MLKKLLAVDIDGTLVTDTKEVTPETKRAIQEFMQKGGVFALATGRPNKGVERYIEELEFEKFGGYVISYNGANILDVKNHKIIYQKFLEKEQLPQVFALAKQYDMPLTTYKDNDAITQKADDKYFHLEVDINGLGLKRVSDLETEITYPIPKFLITGEPEKLSKLEVVLNENLKNVSVFRSEPFFLEITPQGVDKGESILWLANHLGIDKMQTIACGDGFNDVTMIKAAHIGVAMENAQPPVKEVANFITKTNNQNGVLYAMQKFIFNVI